ncbi:MAG: acyl-CoA/acyl-ACP dehydrogenase [Deltaproteobacteria bacterium]|nr:acyl-CoA/acyl-ACP dehydrogenase [Deltaproteobacteria bacterium]MBW2394290.1 acyl-CoA/acyl-ACP dehydrogenase [Deltaproteobacteria bacterium]
MASSGAPKDFGFGEDEELLRDLARKFLDEQLPVEKLRALVAADPEAVYERGEPSTWDEGLWKQIVELGWTGLAVPETAGGAGFKAAGIVGLVEEVGRHALPSPLISTLNATYVLREGEPDAAAAWLARIADGASATLAITDARGSWAAGDTDVSAREEGDAIVLSGRASFVQDAQKAELLVTTARLGDALLLCVVPSDAAGLEFERDHIHDLTRDQASIGFREVRIPTANVVSRDAATALERAWPSVLVTVAADLCGTSEWQLQTTVEYAKHRKQFDHPLGFFQAVKHPLVDVMIGIDRARSILYHAACCIDEGNDGAETAARMAKSAASDAGAYASDRSVQLHGGIGFTWECDVHLFFKRSLHNQLLYGDGTYQRQLLAEKLLA